MPRKKWAGRIYLGLNPDGTQRLYWVGRYATRRERDDAVARARTEKPWQQQPTQTMSCNEWADRHIARYERLARQRQMKSSSVDTARGLLKAFRAEFGERPIDSITPLEAEDWTQTVPAGAVPPVVTMFNYAVKMRVIDHNPFVGLSHKGRGRADLAPPTLDELERLRDGCSVLGDYGRQMRDLLDFAAFTLMRPSELYELRYTDVDLRANRIAKDRRLYRGGVDTPKTGRKTIALVPPAREILLRQPTRARTDGLVFVTKTGTRLAASTMCGYWAQVRAAAGLDESYVFYRCTKHLGVHTLYRLGLSQRAIAAQAGWSEKGVEALLRVYGHADVAALAEVDALYRSLEPDATVMQEAPDEA